MDIHGFMGKHQSRKQGYKCAKLHHKMRMLHNQGHHGCIKISLEMDFYSSLVAIWICLTAVQLIDILSI